MTKIDMLLDSLSELSIIEALELVEKMKSRWGIKTIKRMATLFTPLPAEEPERTGFDVILIDCGPRKIEVIKVIRSLIPDCGLKEAKDLSEGYNGGVIFRGTDSDTASRAMHELNKAGATVKLA